MSGVVVPDGWEIKALKDILTIQYGKDQKEVESEDGKYPILGSGGVIGYTNYFLYDQASVLIGRKGTINNPQYMETPFWTVDTLFYSHIKNNNVPKWVYYVFQSINWNSYNEASGVPSLSTSNINKIEILRPPQKEQEKIAKILSALDKNIENTNRIIEKEKNIKKALMQELLTNGIDKNAKIRSPKTHTYKQSKLGLIPEEWEVVSLIDVTDKNDRYSFTGGPFGSDLKSSDYVDQGVRVIQLQNIGDGEFKNNDFVYTSEQKAQELFSCQIFPNEIIMSKMGDPVGRACLILNIEEKFVMCSDGIRIKVDLNKYDNYFIFLSINNTDFRNSIERVALGSTRKRVGLVELKTLKLKMPRHEEQKQIAKILTTQDKKIETEQKNLSKLQELKKGLMSDLLSGKVRVKV